MRVQVLGRVGLVEVMAVWRVVVISEHQLARALLRRFTNLLFFREDWLRWMTPLRVATSNALIAARTEAAVSSSEGEVSIALRAAVTRVRTSDRTVRFRAARRRSTRSDLAAGIRYLSSRNCPIWTCLKMQTRSIL